MASVYYKSCYEDLLITVALRIKQKRGWHQNNHMLTTLFINVKKKLILQEAISQRTSAEIDHIQTSLPHLYGDVQN